MDPNAGGTDVAVGIGVEGTDGSGLTPDVDASLSSIVAFNRSYGASNTASAATEDPSQQELNEWGKRPAESADIGDAAKRQALEIEAQIQAHIASEYQGQQHQQVGAYGRSEYDEADDEEEDNGVEVHPGWLQPQPQPQQQVMHSAYNAMWDVHMTMRIQSLPLLENLSSQILQTLGRGPYQETLTIVTQPESNQGQAYNSIKRLFDQAKKIYTSEAFLSAEELKLDTPEQRAIIRKVNLATFVSSVFGSQEVGFFHLNEHFMDTFVPDGGRMLKSQGSLYLDLKTQAYISAMATNERSKEEILEDLFPEHMASLLLSRRPGAKQLTPSEADFVSRLIHRRNHLMQISDQVNLSEKYAWQEFLKDVSWYVSKNHETIVAQPTRKTRKRMSHGGGPHPEVMSPPVHAPPTISPMVHHVVQQTPVPLTPEEGTAAAIVQAHTAALSASPHPNQQTPTDPALENEMFSPNTSYMGAPPLAQPPVPQQSQPTQVLYERARLAVTSKASPNARRAGLPSQRRPWTTEEENALMAGLDRVKGPHWSQILAMFGPGGTVSEALKDRNQVQLKDKARNLKLFFLKSGMEVPYYLQFVTGELKTRAPGQAAKNAAKKAVEESAEEDAAHVAAVTALGNAHRSNSHDMTAAYGGISEGSECADMSQPPDSEGSEQGSAPPPERLDMQPPVGTAPQQQVAPQVPIAPVAPMGLPSQDESMTSAAMQQTQNVNESSSIEVRL